MTVSKYLTSIIWILGLSVVAPLAAHPLGNDSITHVSVLYVEPDRLEVDLVLDIAELPSAVLIRDVIDTDGDGRDSTSEQEAWLNHVALEIADLLDARLDGGRLPLRPIEPESASGTGGKDGSPRLLMKLPGEAGMPTFKLAIRYAAAYPQPIGKRLHALTYRDGSFPDHRGLMRIFLERTRLRFRLTDLETVRKLVPLLQPGPMAPEIREAFQGNGITLSRKATLANHAPGTWLITDADHQWIVEPQREALFVYDTPRITFIEPRPLFWDECEQPPLFYEQYDTADLPQIREATVQFRVEGANAGPIAMRAGSIDRYVADWDESSRPRSRASRDADRLIALLQKPWGATLLLTLTGLCFAWGAAHALMPGHAKTLVAAYLISRRGTWRHAIVLAVVVTVTHTALVVILGVVLWAYQYSDPTVGPRLQLWLGVIAGLLVAGMGLFLVHGAVSGKTVHPTHHGHDHQGAIGWLQSLLPHSHPHPVDNVHTHPHDHAHIHPHDQPITVRALVAMGIAGGLMPCPTATLILLLGVGANVVLGALYAVVVFSAGLALTLTAVGFAALSSRKVAARLTGSRWEEDGPSARGRWWLLRAVPAISGLVVAALGTCITAHYAYTLQTGRPLFAWLQ